MISQMEVTLSYKSRNVKLVSHQLMLNIASVNMPKIKPETKVLLIKNLKSKSPAEVADIFNLSKRQTAQDNFSR